MSMKRIWKEEMTEYAWQLVAEAVRGHPLFGAHHIGGMGNVNI